MADRQVVRVLADQRLAQRPRLLVRGQGLLGRADLILDPADAETRAGQLGAEDGVVAMQDLELAE
jgi:hypothetical protein